MNIFRFCRCLLNFRNFAVGLVVFLGANASLTTFAQLGNTYFSCKQIEAGIEWDLDVNQMPVSITPGSKVTLPGWIKITDSRLLDDLFVVSVRSFLNSDEVKGFSVYGAGTYLLADLENEQKNAMNIEFAFHGATAGSFSLTSLYITFITNGYAKAQNCELILPKTSLTVVNNGKIDMSPPEVKSASISRNLKTGNWQLNLAIEDDSKIRTFMPGDDLVSHFQLRNNRTDKVIDCYNDNLQSSGATYFVDLDLSDPNNPSKKSVVVDPGTYQLVGFNVSDEWGNLVHEIKNPPEFKAIEAFYCQR